MENKVKEVRKSLKMSQIDLADKAGVSRQTIISIERGRYIPSTLLGKKIAYFLNTTVDELFILEDDDLNSGGG